MSEKFFKVMEHYSILMQPDDYSRFTTRNEQIVAPNIDRAMQVARETFPFLNVIGATKIGNVTVDVREDY